MSTERRVLWLRIALAIATAFVVASIAMRFVTEHNPIESIARSTAVMGLATILLLCTTDPWFYSVSRLMAAAAALLALGSAVAIVTLPAPIAAVAWLGFTGSLLVGAAAIMRIFFGPPRRTASN